MNTSASTPGTSRDSTSTAFGPCSASSACSSMMLIVMSVGQMIEEIGDVVIFGRAVDDHVDAVLAPRDHQVVENAAILGEQQRIAHLRRAKPLDVARQQRLERRVGALAGKQQLAHMADVEQRRRTRAVHRCSAMMPSYCTGM